MNQMSTRWLVSTFFMLNIICLQNNMVGNPQKALPLHKLVLKKRNPDISPLKKFMIRKDNENLFREAIEKSCENKPYVKNDYRHLFFESDILLRPKKKNVNIPLTLFDLLYKFTALQNLSTSRYE